MAGITEDVMDVCEAWLAGHGHSMATIASNGPGSEEARSMAAVAVHLNVLTASTMETAVLAVDCLAFTRSGGRVCRHIMDARGA